MISTWRELIGEFGLGPVAAERTRAMIQEEVKKQGLGTARTRTLGYAAAKINRFTDFMTTLEAAHKERQRDLVRLRAHSRDLAKNNAYMGRFLELVSTHVVGPDGITFESNITGNKNKPKEDWNNAIEEAFLAWGQSCTVGEPQDWVGFQQLVVETVAQDGECLIRRVRGFGNASRYALELIDADRLDWTYTLAGLPGGARIIMGVEVDAFGKPLAYHIWSAHPYDAEARPVRQRIPADQIIHLYAKDRARATRGIPWATRVMVQLNMLGRLWTSELAASNAEADRLGIVKTAQGAPLDDIDADPVETANELQSEHAQFLGLDPGLDIVFPNLQHPNSQLGIFSKDLLKGVASGLGCSYHSLSGDVSDTSYSSGRLSLLDERDMWRKRQRWLISGLHQVVYRDWLEMALLAGVVTIPALDFQKVCKPTWWARTWDWIDPQKDVDAALTAIRGGLSTYQKERGARGLQMRETFQQLKESKDLANELGLVLDEPNTKAITKPPPPDPAPDPSPKGAKP